MAKEKKKRRRRCSECGKLKLDARRCLDPCVWELERVKVYRILCDECWELVNGDI